MLEEKIEIKNKIYEIRGQQVMLDSDLAKLYQVETKVFLQAVKRNIKRFPDNFMFQLSNEEFMNWRSHFAISKGDLKGLRRPPYAFTKHGIMMLSGLLKNYIAVEINDVLTLVDYKKA